MRNLIQLFTIQCVLKCEEFVATVAETAVVNIYLPSEGHKNINSARKSRTCFLKTVLGFQVLYYLGLACLWLGLAIDLRTDLRSVQVAHRVERIQ
jgi:hypothetical protein